MPTFDLGVASRARRGRDPIPDFEGGGANHRRPHFGDGACTTLRREAIARRGVGRVEDEAFNFSHADERPRMCCSQSSASRLTAPRVERPPA